MPTWAGLLKASPSNPTTPRAENLYPNPVLLCHIWDFARYYGIPALGNAAIDTYHEIVSASWGCNPQFISITYAYSKPQTKFRSFLVDAIARTHGIEECIFFKKTGRISPELMHEVMPIVLDVKKNGRVLSRDEWTKVDRCRWHDHSGPLQLAA
jgi:hypothetical protein